MLEIVLGKKLLFVLVFNNGLVIQFFESLLDKAYRNRYETIIFPLSFSNQNYIVTICSIETNSSSAEQLSVTNVDISRMSINECTMRVYGHGNADIVNGFCGICIGF